MSLFWFLNIRHHPKVTVLRCWST